MSYPHQKLEGFFLLSGSPRLHTCTFPGIKAKVSGASLGNMILCLKLLKQHTHNTVVEMVEAQCHLQRYVIVSATSNVKYANN